MHRSWSPVRLFALEPIESPTGTLVISFDADHDQRIDLSRSLDFADWHIGPNHEALLGQVSLRSTATLTGSVLLEGRASGSLAGTDVFLPGLPVSTTTSDTGAFTLAGVPEGPVSVAAASPGFVTKRLDGLAARSGELLVLAPLTLSPAPVAFTQVQGRVELVPDGDLSSVSVVALGALGATALTVDGSGDVHGQVLAGHLTFLARAPQFSDAVIANLVAVPDGTLDLGTLRLEHGTFTFDAGQPPAGSGGTLCGNSTVEAGETCDDGNRLAGDGCSSTCTLEVQVGGGESCLDPQLLHLSRIGPVDFGARFVAQGASKGTLQSSCGTTGVRTFRVSLASRSRLSLSTTAMVSLRAASCSTELQCGAPFLLSGALEAGEHVFAVLGVTVDVPVQLTVTPLAPGPYCGDGVVGEGEACDPGPSADFRACSQLCALNVQETSNACTLASPLAFANVGPSRVAANVQGQFFGTDARFHGTCFGSSPLVTLARIRLPSRGTVHIDTAPVSTDVGIALFSDDCLAPHQLGCVAEMPGGLGHVPFDQVLDAGSYVVAFNANQQVTPWLGGLVTVQQ